MSWLLKVCLPKETCEVCKKSTVTHMCWDQGKDSRIMKNKVNMALPKETNKVLITGPEELEIYVKELKIILLRTFSELHEHTATSTKLGK